MFHIDQLQRYNVNSHNTTRPHRDRSKAPTFIFGNLHACSAGTLDQMCLSLAVVSSGRLTPIHHLTTMGPGLSSTTLFATLIANVFYGKLEL